MGSVSGDDLPKRDLEYVAGLVNKISNRFDTSAERVLNLLRDLKVTLNDQKLNYEEASSKLKLLHHQFKEIIIKLDEDINVTSEGWDRLSEDVLGLHDDLDKTQRIVSEILPQPFKPHEDSSETIVLHDLDSDKMLLKADSQYVSESLNIINQNLENLNRLKRLTEKQLTLLTNYEPKSTEKKVLEKVKELAFRIFYDKNTLPLEIDEKLSGSTPANSLEKVIDDIEKKDSNGNPIFEKVFGKKMFQECLLKLKSLQNDMKQFSRYQFETDPIKKEEALEEITTNYSSLEVGQSKLFQGGYNNRVVGHSVLYEFKRLSEDSFELSLFNTGEGRPVLGPKVLRYKISLEKMKDKEFLRGLLAFKMVSDKPEKAGIESIKRMKDVYEYLNKEVGNGSYGDSIPPQTWGNCAYMTLKAWLFSKLNTKSYDTFHKLSRENAAEELKEYLPTLSEETKQKIFGDSLISQLNRKVDVITFYERIPILGRIAKLIYYFFVQNFNTGYLRDKDQN